MKSKIYFLIALLVVFSLLFSSCDSAGEKNKNVAESPQKITPLKIGDKIPTIILNDYSGNVIELNKLFPFKPTILIYYRGIWCMYCNQQIAQIKEISQELQDMGYQLIAVSADKPEKVFEMKEKYEIGFTLLSDTSMSGAKSLGIAYDGKSIYQDMLLVLEENSGTNNHILPVPSIFIINQEGIIQFEYINPNFKVRISPELLLTAAKVALEE